jgi:hypothetical protein
LPSEQNTPRESLGDEDVQSNLIFSAVTSPVSVFLIVMLPSSSLIATKSSFKRSPSSDGLFAIGSSVEQLLTKAEYRRFFYCMDKIGVSYFSPK